MEAKRIPSESFLEWILENTKNCLDPEKISSICDRYKDGSLKQNAQNLRDQIKRAVARKDKRMQLEPLQIVQLCFVLSIAVPEHRKDDLKAAGTLSLDKFDRIEKFHSHDNSYKKEGTHSFYGLSKRSKRIKDVTITVTELGEGPSRKLHQSDPTISAKTLSKQLLNYSAVMETVCLPLYREWDQQIARGTDNEITLETFATKFEEAHKALSNTATPCPNGTDRFVPIIECLKLLKFLLLNLDVPEEHPATKNVSEDIRDFTNKLLATFVPITSVDFMLSAGSTIDIKRCEEVGSSHRSATMRYNNKVTKKLTPFLEAYKRDKELPDNVIDRLAQSTKLERRKVKKWFENKSRDRRGDGATKKKPVSRKTKKEAKAKSGNKSEVEKEPESTSSHTKDKSGKFTDEVRKILINAFKESPKLNPARRSEIAKNAKLSTIQVRDFFKKLRANQKKNDMAVAAAQSAPSRSRAVDDKSEDSGEEANEEEGNQLSPGGKSQRSTSRRHVARRTSSDDGNNDDDEDGDNRSEVNDRVEISPSRRPQATGRTLGGEKGDEEDEEDDVNDLDGSEGDESDGEDEDQYFVGGSVEDLVLSDHEEFGDNNSITDSARDGEDHELESVEELDGSQPSAAGRVESSPSHGQVVPSTDRASHGEGEDAALAVHKDPAIPAQKDMQHGPNIGNIQEVREQAPRNNGIALGPIVANQRNPRAVGNRAVRHVPRGPAQILEPPNILDKIINEINQTVEDKTRISSMPSNHSLIPYNVIETKPNIMVKEGVRNQQKEQEAARSGCRPRGRNHRVVAALPSRQASQTPSPNAPRDSSLSFHQTNNPCARKRAGSPSNCHEPEKQQRKESVEILPPETEESATDRKLLYLLASHPISKTPGYPHIYIDDICRSRSQAKELISALHMRRRLFLTRRNDGNIDTPSDWMEAVKECIETVTGDP